MPPDPTGTIVLVLAGGTGEGPVQQQEQLVEDSGHVDHDSHFSWTHGFMFPVYGAVAVALIAGGVKIWLGRRK